MSFRFGLAPLILTVVAGQAELRDVTSPPAVTVRVFDYAGIGARPLAGMRREAQRLFRLAGVATVWIVCPGPAACSQPLRPGEFILRILAAGPGSTLGCALVTPEGGAYASIFFAPAAAVAADSQTSVAPLLGAVAAHEVAHLLLGPHSHAPSGLMAASFGGRELGRLNKGWLVFSEAQSKLLRARAAALHAAIDAHAGINEGPALQAFPLPRRSKTSFMDPCR
jgi:hypothetical protein